MKTILTIALLLLTTIGFGSPNTKNENTVLKITCVGNQSGTKIFRLYNKQNCKVKIQYKVESLNIVETIEVNGKSFRDVVINTTKDITMKARARNFCDCDEDDSWVETDCSNGSLPIKFEYIRAKKISSNEIEVEFKAESTDNESQFNIQISKDGRTFKTVAIILTDPILPNKIYKVKVRV